MIRVAGKERPWREGMTVADVLKELGGESAACPVVRAIEPKSVETEQVLNGLIRAL